MCLARRRNSCKALPRPRGPAPRRLIHAKLIHAGRRYSKKGQALVEYVLLIGLAASISVAFMMSFKDFMQDGIRKFNAVLERDLRTGSSVRGGNPGVWDN